MWLSEGNISDQFDFGGDALQNFKVVFGFREYRKHVDGGVKDGPYWDLLQASPPTIPMTKRPTLWCADLHKRQSWTTASSTAPSRKSVPTIGRVVFYRRSNKCDCHAHRWSDDRTRRSDRSTGSGRVSGDPGRAGGAAADAFESAIAVGEKRLDPDIRRPANGVRPAVLRRRAQWRLEARRIRSGPIVASFRSFDYTRRLPCACAARRRPT